MVHLIEYGMLVTSEDAESSSKILGIGSAKYYQTLSYKLFIRSHI